MTDKQIAAAHRMMRKLINIRESLKKTRTAGCLTLEQVNESALQSNATCIRILDDSMKVAFRNAV